MNACTLHGSTNIAAVVPILDAGAFVADLTEASAVPEDRLRQAPSILVAIRTWRTEDDYLGSARAALFDTVPASTGGADSMR